MKAHYLYPGKLAAFKEPTIISTLLGSCVSVVLYDPKTAIGGMNHFLLPELAPGEAPIARYGSVALPQLIADLEALGASFKNLQAKVYGGANVISLNSSITVGIGSRNVEYALRFLQAKKIPVVFQSVGGDSARTIKFNSSNFEVIEVISEETKSAAEPQKKVDVSGFKPLPVMKAIKVLIVDDSATVRTLFTSIFEKSGLIVVGAAGDAYQAREMIAALKPDVMTLDIEMPKMSGVAFLQKIMQHFPIPTVMVSSLSTQGEAAMQALEFGAIEFVHKPSQFDPAALRTLAESLITKVQAAAAVRVTPKKFVTSDLSTQSRVKATQELKLVVVGGNAGSASSLETLINSLAQDTPAVLVANSTVSAFNTAFISKLQKTAKVKVKEVTEGEILLLGTVYLTPPKHHVEILATRQGPVAKLKSGIPISSQIPSADVLFKSAAEQLKGQALGILLGGFGIDGVLGVSQLQAAGAPVYVQNPDEAQFPFAPQKAIQDGYGSLVLSASEMNNELLQYRNKNLY